MLIVFDYSSNGQYTGGNPFHDDNDAPFRPINLATATHDFLKTGWIIKDVIDLTENYIAWYQHIVEKLKTNQRMLSAQFSETAHTLVTQGFVNILNLLQSNVIGGTVLYAIKA